jgi:hypothetical protein
MIVRSDLMFRSELVDKGVTAQDGSEVLEWPGRLHALAVAEILKGLGCQLSPLLCLGPPCWDMQALLGPKLIWLRVMFAGDEVFLIVKDGNPGRTWYFARKPPGPVFTGMLTSLDEALRADGRFHDLRWLTPEEFHNEAPGAPAPVSEVVEMAGHTPRPWREWDRPWRDR